MYKRILIAVGLLLMLAGIFGFSYMYSYDHRTTESLSAYCRIDFQSSHTESGALEGAVLTIWDSRYGTEKLLPQAVLYTDGRILECRGNVDEDVPPGYEVLVEVLMELAKETYTED